MSHVPPYRDNPPGEEPLRSLPDRFLNWLEELRAFLRPIPHYTKTAGSPEGVIDGVKGDRYYDTTDNLIYYKTTDTGNTGWVALSQPIAGLGVWRYRTETDATPASGRMQFDSTTIASVTEMYVNVTNLAGTDVSVILATIVANDLLYVQVQNSADQFIVIQTGAPSVSAGVYTFPVNAVVGQGTGSGVANNTPVIIVTG